MNTDGIVKIFSERKEANREASVLRHARRRVAAAAENLSRRGAAAAAAEICNDAICKLIELAYQVDETGLCNVDHDGRLLVPAPWGRNGRYYFGLRATEGDVLRRHCYRLMEIPAPAPLWVYDPITRSWYLNLLDYPSAGRALAYWRTASLDAQTYKTLVETVRKGRTVSA